MLPRICCFLVATKSPKTIFSLMCLAGTIIFIILLYFSDLRQLFLSSFQPTQSQAKSDFHAFGHGADRICAFDVQNTKTVIFVNSVPRNMLRRQVIRSTWGHPNFTKPLGLSVMFMVAEANDPEIQTLVDWEAQVYGDVSQGTFRDTYQSLSKKSLYGLSWVLKHCDQARYVIKTDDDVFVNTFALDRFLKSQKPDDRSLLCLVWKDMPVIRRTGTEWTITQDQFNGSVYPTYCSGLAYIMPMPVAQMLLNASFKIPEFPLEDVYLTGILARFAGVSHKQIAFYYAFKYQNEEDLAEGKIIFSYLNEEREIPEAKMWEKILEREKKRVPSRVKNLIL